MKQLGGHFLMLSKMSLSTISCNLLVSIIFLNHFPKIFSYLSNLNVKLSKSY